MEFLVEKYIVDIFFYYVVVLLIFDYGFSFCFEEIKELIMVIVGEVINFFMV